MNNFPFARVKKKKKKNYVKSSKASLRIKKSPVQRKNQKGDISGGFSFETHDSKKKRKKSTLPAGKTHTHTNPHTLSLLKESVAPLFRPLWMEQLRSQSLAPPPRDRVLLLLLLLGVVFFFSLHVSLWCPPGCWLRGHPFIPPHPPREEHLATMTITCHITAASHTHVQTKATTTWL